VKMKMFGRTKTTMQQILLLAVSALGQSLKLTAAYINITQYLGAYVTRVARCPVLNLPISVTDNIFSAYCRLLAYVASK